MGTYQLETPNGGLQSFEIDGDKPTEEELVSIQKYVEKNRTQTQSDVDVFFEQAGTPVRDGLSSTTDPSQYVDQNIAQSPDREKYDADVDYSSGIKNAGFRLRFSNLNNDKEKALLLNKELGPQKEFWDVDKIGRFILTTAGRQKLGDTGEGKIAIDEEGFSWNDLTDFIGEAGMPIAGAIAGTLGALAFAPVAAPLLVASAGAGLGAGAFTFFDELQQKGRGVADEDFNEYGKRAAVETALAAGGEYVGCVLFNTIRRLFKKTGGAGFTKGEIAEINEKLLKEDPSAKKFKDPTRFTTDVFLGRSAGKEGMERAEQLKSLIKEGYTPDMTGEGLSNRPILGVNVKIFESIFPGRVDENATILRRRIADELFEGREDWLDTAELEKMVKEFESGKLRIGSEMVDLAEDDIKNYLTTAYDGILNKIVTQGFDSGQAAKQLSEVQQAFHKTMDDTFEAIDTDMGVANMKLQAASKGKNLDETAFTPEELADMESLGDDVLKQLAADGIPTDELRKISDTLIIKPNVAGTAGPRGPAFIIPTQFRNALEELVQEGGLDPLRVNNPLVKQLIIPDEDNPLTHLSLRQVNNIRGYINNFDAETALVGDKSKFGLAQLRESLDNDLASSANRIRDINDILSKRTALNEPQKNLKDAFKIMERSVDDLEKAQINYRNFMEHQDDALIRSIAKSTADKKIDPAQYLNTLLDSPTNLAKFISSLRKAKSSPGIEDIRKNLKQPDEFTMGERETASRLEARILGKDFADTTAQERAKVFQNVESKIKAGEVLTDPNEMNLKNIIDNVQRRKENFQSFNVALNDTLPQIENKSIELLQKKFFQNAIEKATVDGKFDVRRFGQYIDSFNAKPRVAKGIKPGTAESGTIAPEFENKTFFEMLFPDGKGIELIDNIQKLNRNIADGEIDNFTFIADDLSLNNPTPNIAGQQIDELISKIKEGKELSETLVGPQSARMADLAENQTGSQALRYIVGRSPGEQAQYFRAANKHINKLEEAGKKNEAAEFNKFRDGVRDLVLARLIDRGSGNSADAVFNVLDPRRLSRLLSEEGRISGYSPTDMNEIFGIEFDKKIFGKVPKNFREALKLFGKEAELVSSLGGAKKDIGVGLQAATAKANASQGFLSGSAKQAWSGLSKIGRALVMSRTIQSKFYMDIATNPPQSLAQMSKQRQLLRSAFIQALNQVITEGTQDVGEEIVESVREDIKPRVEEVTERVTESVRPETQGGPEVERDERAVEIQTPRIPIPSPQEISLRGPAMDLSSGNIERDIALGAAGTNPTTQALLRARGRA